MAIEDRHHRHGEIGAIDRLTRVDQDAADVVRAQAKRALHGEDVGLQLHAGSGQVSAERLIEDRRTLQDTASQKQLRVEGLLAGDRNVGPQRQELDAALTAGPDALVERLEMRQVNQRAQQRLPVQVRGFVWRILRHQHLQRAIRLLERPSQLAPHPHQQIDAEIDDRIRFRPVGISQRRQIEITAGIGIGKDEDAAEWNGLNRRFELRDRHVEACRGGVQCGLKGLRLEPALLIVRRQRSGVLGEQPAMCEVKLRVGDGHTQLVEDRELAELGIHETGLHELGGLLERDAESPRQRFCRSQHRRRVADQLIAGIGRNGPRPVERNPRPSRAPGIRGANGAHDPGLGTRRVRARVEEGVGEAGRDLRCVCIGDAHGRIGGVGGALNGCPDDRVAIQCEPAIAGQRIGIGEDPQLLGRHGDRLQENRRPIERLGRRE